ncbi:MULTISPECIES: LacI family DNA-binding transcriptional regulator [unclassified Modicisalibacter]|uniref:LacI family DNA-binding transcriptional regulator n=1 Tax=unclassified Modicisalibacter TaxID=2679913 RepID=UPI001CCAEC70|nr:MULTISPECIES: LacI family DNA-binding transcriptional regulator [unclassified Modicisalibacter]MBZ9558624.1 LacI family DNA-binding transcriptional regulator [Modicisalibacter sp. R2A 31.J]MBZ9575484.1 LacI family DNA-binding transcriptional regulator [Modicisalibacter sp. MOD 31.J]
MGEVAQLADVSPSTVSLYLRRPDEVSNHRAERIQRAIDRLGYLPNTMAGGLASSRSNVIGVIVPTITNSFFSATLESLERHLRSAGYQLLIGNTEFDESREEELIRSIMSWNPAGLVLTGFLHNRKAISLLARGDTPIVEMWDFGRDGLDMVVGFSHRTCGRLVAEHLIQKGYRKTAFLSTNFQRDVRASDRFQGFRDAVVQSGGTVMLRELSDRSNTVETGHLLNALIDDHPDIEAVCCSNDMVALGVMFECQRQGWAVPERLAVAGFGNQDFTASTVPPMTTIEPPRQEIGRHIARLLLSRLNGDLADHEKNLDLGVELVVRGST